MACRYAREFENGVHTEIKDTTASSATEMLENVAKKYI